MAHSAQINVNGVLTTVTEFDNPAQSIDDAVNVLGAPTTPQAALSALGAGVRLNLLDNPYFVGGGGPNALPVNQITGKPDRWEIMNSASVVIKPNSLSFSGTTGSADGYYPQIVPMSKIVLGKTYTASALFLSGIDTKRVSVVCYNSGSTGYNIFAGNAVIADGISFVTFTIPADTTSVEFRIEVGDYGVIGGFEAAGGKLEEGDTQTLAYQDADGTWKLLPQPDSGYGTQLAKCQARLLILQNQTIPVTVFSKSVSGVIPTPVTMDEGAVPTVTFSGSAFLYVPSGIVGVDPSTYSGISVQQNGVVFSGTSEVSSNVPGVLTVDKIIISRKL